jgi:hypothetical protein
LLSGYDQELPQVAGLLADVLVLGFEPVDLVLELPKRR